MIPQSSRDRILWILTNSSGKMERSRLRRCAGMRLADLNPILGELAREGICSIKPEFGQLVKAGIDRGKISSPVRE